MGAAPLVILLVGLVMPIVVLILALAFDLLFALWLVYQLWRDEWSNRLWEFLHRQPSLPHWHWHWNLHLRHR